MPRLFNKGWIPSMVAAQRKKRLSEGTTDVVFVYCCSQFDEPYFCVLDQ